MLVYACQYFTAGIDGLVFFSSLCLSTYLHYLHIFFSTAQDVLKSPLMAYSRHFLVKDIALSKCFGFELYLFANNFA